MEQIKNPMTTPDYTIPENYTTDDLRAIAVRAMRDILSIPWQADKVYEYKNQWDLPNKLFHFEPGMVYAGLPYANAHTGIFQWMKYYDAETGMMSFPGEGQKWGETLGTVCANCILWAWSIFSNSIGGKYHSFTMAPVYGFLPVGNYRWPEDVDDFRNHSTKLICEDNGKPAILEVYAGMLPADGLISTPDGHAVMVIEKPHVVRLPDGSIDPEASTVMIQDQRGGQAEGFFEREQDGVIHHYSGRIDFVYTFEKLWSLSYIPVTTKELLGLKPVSAPYLEFCGNADSVENFLQGTIKTNYLLCNLEAILVTPEGERRAALAHYIKLDTETAIIGDGVEYPTAKLADCGLWGGFEDAPAGATLRLEAQIATGGLYPLATITL